MFDFFIATKRERKEQKIEIAHVTYTDDGGDD